MRYCLLKSLQKASTAVNDSGKSFIEMTPGYLITVIVSVSQTKFCTQLLICLIFQNFPGEDTPGPP